MNPFQMVGGLRPSRSVFNLSYEKKLTCDMGQLIPVMCDEVIPGDKFIIGNQMVVRFQPLLAPVMHEVNAYVHYFFVPYRILWDQWEDFITGGVDGEDSSVLPQYNTANVTSKYSLADYLGMPVGIRYNTPTTVQAPMRFPWDAYYKIYNEYYRDETLVDEVPVVLAPTPYTNDQILNRAWEKDYFTSALPWMQRGVAPSIPITGAGVAVFNGPVAANVYSSASPYGLSPSVASPGTLGWYTTAAGAPNTDYASKFRDWLNNNNSVTFNNSSSFTVADMRLAFQVQKWMERNARGGVRYTEFLQSHWGVSPRDERLQRPEYIGGSVSPIIFSEVLQTSASVSGQTPQANMAGHGISVNSQKCASYTASEFGLIMGILSIMPRTGYSQGINRQWLRLSRFDFPFPEFVNLSEQAISQREIYARGTPADSTVFGYQGRFDELRYKPGQFVADMRDTFDYWHLGRKFSTAPALNSSFINCVPSKRIFAVQNEPGLIVNFGNIIKAIRPIPIQSNPGLIDHN